MKQYSYAQAPLLSFYSGDFYRHIANDRSGTGFLYLLLLLTICVVPNVFKAESGFDDFVKNEAPRFITQVPEITIANGEASIEEPQPYAIFDPDTNKPIVVIDTTGQITSLQDTEAKVLITKKYVIYEKSLYETRTYDLSEIEYFVLSQSVLNEWAGIAQEYFVVTLYPLMLLGLFIAQIIRILIYALIGMIFVKILKSSNDYGSLIRLSVISITPALLIEFVFELTGLSIPFSGLMLFVIAMLYLFFGVYSSRANEAS